MSEPLQNRVKPDGEIVCIPARGALMGNRGGRIHDPETRQLTRRRWASKAWISCALSFRDRWRPVMGKGYTELFFLDEVTALSGGHRPCFECRRQDAVRFATLFGQAVLGRDGRASAADMDTRLHQERLKKAKGPVLDLEALENLPDGAMVQGRNDFFAIRGGTLRPWTFRGYEAPLSYVSLFGVDNELRLVTPPSILSVLRHGYRPRWHPSVEPSQD